MSDPPDNLEPPIKQPRQHRHMQVSRLGIFTMLALISLLLMLFTGMLLYSLTPQAQDAAAASATATAVAFQASQPSPVLRTPTPTPKPGVTPTPNPPIAGPNNADISALTLPGGHYLIYEQPVSQNPAAAPTLPPGLYLLPLDSGVPQQLNAPGYAYNAAVRPILTPAGQLLYSGSNGLWSLDIFSGHAIQLAELAPASVITSLALSSNGQLVAWSTEPTNGQGTINIYAGPLADPTLVYQQPTANCPCFRVFGVLGSSAQSVLAHLLLTDSRGSHEAVQNGLWELTITLATGSTDVPVSLLDEDPQQGPLLLSPSQNLLLYSTNQGQVPYPTDNSVPPDIAALSYSNSLSLASIGGQTLNLGPSQTILAEQHNLRSIAEYHWVTTPLFTPDEHSLVYVEFSSDAQAPYDRHSALYMTSISGSGTHLHLSAPKLLITSTAALFELGPWLNDHILTFYADNNIFAVDLQSGSTSTLLQAGTYVRAIAIVGNSPT